MTADEKQTVQLAVRAAERRERARLAWIAFMAACITSDGGTAQYEARMADEALDEYIERWEQEDVKPQSVQRLVVKEGL